MNLDDFLDIRSEEKQKTTNINKLVNKDTDKNVNIKENIDKNKEIQNKSNFFSDKNLKIDELNKELQELKFLNTNNREIDTTNNLNRDLIVEVETKDNLKGFDEVKAKRLETSRELNVDRLDKIKEIEKELAQEKDTKTDKIYVYKNDRKTVQQKVVERRNEKVAYREYRENLHQFKNAYTDKQRVYFEQKIKWYEERQIKKSEWDQLNKQSFEAKKLNYYDIKIWEAAQENKGILTEKSVREYANKAFPDEIKRNKFINYTESKLTEFERLRMINDKSQTNIQKLDVFGVVTKKTNTDYESRTIYFNDERIDRRILEIENHIKSMDLVDKVKYNFSSPVTQDVYEEKKRIELTLREEKTAGKDYKDLYKDFLTNKGRNLNELSNKQIQAEYEALKVLKRESSKEIRIRKNYKFEVNYNFLNKVKEYEKEQQDNKEKQFIDKNRDNMRYEPLAIFDKEISDYMSKNKGILDNNIFNIIKQKEGDTPEINRKIELIKTRIFDLKANDCLEVMLDKRELNNLKPGEFKFVTTKKYNIKDYYKNIGSKLDTEIYDFLEKNKKTFKFKDFDEYVRDNNTNLSEEELQKKIDITQHRVKQLYANDYFYKVADDVYVSKKSFDDIMSLNNAYIRFKEGENVSSNWVSDEKRNQKINSFGCQIDKSIFEKSGKDGIVNIENCLDGADERQANIIKGRFNKLVQYGYLEKLDGASFKIAGQFKIELKRKELQDEQDLKDRNFKKFKFKKVDHNNYFKTLRTYIEKQGYFNEAEYKLIRYGDKSIKADDMKFNDKCMIKRFQTMLNSGILEKDDKGNLMITQRGLQVERDFLEKEKNTNINTDKNVNVITNIKGNNTIDKPKEVKFTSFDYTNIAVAVDNKGIFSKENFINHFSNNNFIGAKGQSYNWTTEQINGKYITSIKRLETHIQLNNLSVKKLPDGSYKLDPYFIDRALIEFEKHKLKGKEKTVLLNKDQDILVQDIGSFGQLTENQIINYIYNGRNDLFKIDLEDLKRKGLVEIEKFNLKHIGEQNIITLTSKGRAVAEMNTGKDRIATKDKLNKEGELAHDLYVYDTVKYIENELKKENKKIEIVYSDRQMKSYQQSILAREYGNIGIGMATVYILEEAKKNNIVNRNNYEDKMNDLYRKQSFINKKMTSFDKSFATLKDKHFIKKVEGKYELTEKGNILLNDVSSGRLQVMYSDCQIIVRDIDTGERSTINIEVDLGYTEDEVKEKAMNVPNQIWATNSIKQKDIITKYVSNTVFLLR